MKLPLLIATDANQKPVPHAVVVLVPPPARRQNSALYQSTRCDENGFFTFTGVAPGDYKIFAWETVLLSAWLNAEFISKVEDQGRGLSVKEKNIFGLKIQAIPAR